MRLHHHPLSANSRRATMTALELGLDVELVVVDLAKGEQRTPEFHQLNPSGKVPVLEDDDFVLSESHAIMVYLAEKAPGQSLYPTAPKARAKVNQWLFWSAQELTPAVSTLNWENFIKGMLGLGAPEPVLVEKGLFGVRGCLQRLNFALEGKTWLVGESFSLADLAVGALLMTKVPAKLPVDEFPHVVAWFERLSSRDSWKKTEPRH